MASIMTETGSHTKYPKAGPAPLAQVRAYWEALREDGALPLRSQISPRGIESALSSTFLIERVAPGIARFRIAGMDLGNIMGMEVRGLPFSALFTPSARADLASKLEMIFHAPSILTLDLLADSGIGRPALAGRMQLLPLRSEAGATGLALGCLALEGSIGRSPRRFEIDRSTLTDLGQTAPATENPAVEKHGISAKGFVPHVMENSKPHAFAEPAKAFAGRPKSKTISYLQLVK